MVNLTGMYRSFFSIVLLVGLLSCTPDKEQKSIVVDPFSQIKDEQVADILRRAISVAGGWEDWSRIRTIQYTKRGVLLLEDGTVESDLTQRHEYTMQPIFSATISWEKEGENHIVKLDSTGCIKMVDGVIQDQSERALIESVYSSLYVLGMPFKLLDAGTQLAYQGIETLRDGTAVDVIKATYDPGEHDNHSTVDEWYYYFDQETGHFNGCMVYHAPTYAYIENLDFYSDTPVKFHQHRKSYRSDSLRNIKFLRAEFWYSDYEVN